MASLLVSFSARTRSQPIMKQFTTFFRIICDVVSPGDVAWGDTHNRFDPQESKQQSGTRKSGFNVHRLRVVRYLSRIFFYSLGQRSFHIANRRPCTTTTETSFCHVSEQLISIQLVRHNLHQSEAIRTRKK